MGFAIDQRREGAAGQSGRLGLLAGETGQTLGADTLDFRRTKGRITQHIGKQGQRRLQIGADAAEAGHSAVHAGAKAERCTQTFLRLGQSQTVARGRAFFHDVQHQGVRTQTVGTVGGNTGIELQRDTRHRHGGRVHIDHLDTVRQGGAFHVGEVHILDVTNRRCRITLDTHDFCGRCRCCARRRRSGIDIGLALARQHGLAIDRTGQPALHGILDLLRRHRRIAFQLLLVVIGITGIKLPLGQNRSLAIGLFQTLDGARRILRHDAVDLVLRRAIGHQLVKGGVHLGGHGFWVLTRLHRHRIGEHADALEHLIACRDARRRLVTPHQSIVQTRAVQTTQN